MESRFANSFFSGATTNHTTNNNNNNRRILENRNGEAHQHKRPKLDICVPRSTCAFKETPKVIERSIIEDESVWEDFDEEDVLEKADCVERASQAFTTSSGDSDQAKCNIEKSGLLTKPIVKPKDKPTISVSKYSQVVSTQRHNSLQTIAKEQPLKKNVIFKAASTGNMKNSYSPSSSSSSSGISLLSHTSFSPRIKVTKKETSEEFPTIAKAPHAIKCKECELLSTQLQTLTEKIQTKDGEISLLRSNLEETRSKTFKGKDEMGSLVEKTHLLEKTISDQNTVISFMSGELQSKSQTCDRLKSSLKQRSTHSSFSASSKASANKATITDASLVNFSQQKEMSFSPDMLTQLAKHDGRLLFDICSAELTESHRPIFFLQNLDGAGEDLQDDRWFVSILFEFQKHQSFSSDVAASCLDKLIAICRGSIEEIDRNGEATVSQYQRVKELYNKHHEIAPLSKSYRFFSPKPWYSEESGIKVRRLLHLISKIIDIEPKLAYIVVSDNSSSVDNCEFKLPRSSNSETSLLYVLRDTLKRIKDECFSLNLNGFLASSASLMISIMKSKIEIDEKGQKLINEILRLILLCCPGPTAMLFACKILLVVDDKYSFINNDLCRNTPKEHMDSERSNTFDEGTCTVTLICYLVQAIKNDPKIYLITDVLVRWLRIIQTKWDKSNHPPWLNWGSLAQLPANHKLLCDCRFELNKLILKLLYEAAELFSNDSHDMKHEEKRSLEMLLDRGIALIFAAAIGEDRSISIEPGEIEAHYELFVHTLSVCSDLNVSSIQQKNLKHLALQEIKEPTRQDVNEDDECTELSRKMCTF